jgi:hypothetical protein
VFVQTSLLNGIRRAGDVVASFSMSLAGYIYEQASLVISTQSSTNHQFRSSARINPDIALHEDLIHVGGGSLPATDQSKAVTETHIDLSSYSIDALANKIVTERWHVSKVLEIIDALVLFVHTNATTQGGPANPYTCTFIHNANSNVANKKYFQSMDDIVNLAITLTPTYECTYEPASTPPISISAQANLSASQNCMPTPGSSFSPSYPTSSTPSQQQLQPGASVDNLARVQSPAEDARTPPSSTPVRAPVTPYRHANELLDFLFENSPATNAHATAFTNIQLDSHVNVLADTPLVSSAAACCDDNFKVGVVQRFMCASLYIEAADFIGVCLEGKDRSIDAWLQTKLLESLLLGFRGMVAERIIRTQ